jgi:hypothetical protein
VRDLPSHQDRDKGKCKCKLHVEEKVTTFQTKRKVIKRENKKKKAKQPKKKKISERNDVIFWMFFDILSINE